MCYTIFRFKLTAKEFLRKKNTKKEITKTMSLNSTPSADRVHIGIFGRRNAGKSSCLHLGGSLWQISSSGKEPGALPLSSAGIPDPLPDSEPIGNGTEGRGSYCPHFGSKGGGAADRCCAGRI